MSLKMYLLKKSYYSFKKKFFIIRVKIIKDEIFYLNKIFLSFNKVLKEIKDYILFLDILNLKYFY
jgi:hypothetical protein